MKLWRQYRERHGQNAWRYISQVFDEFRQGFFERKRQQGKNPQQAWNNFKGKALEELLRVLIQESVESIGIKCLLGARLGRAKLNDEESIIHQKVSVRFGPYRLLPDPDLVVYTPDRHVLAVVSCKTTLRERVAQVAFWKRKLREDRATAHIRVLLATLDEDDDLRRKAPPPEKYHAGFKNRILVEYELDSTYVLTTEPIEESAKVKLFDKFINDLQALLARGRNA